MYKFKLNLRKVIAIAICLAGSVTMFAQDIIILKNGNDIQAIVQEVDIDVVKYKRFDNPNGPNYTLKKSDIFMIRYANGSKDVYNEVAMPTSAEVQRRAAVNQQINPYNNNINSRQQLPVQKYTFGNQINPYGSEKSPFLAGFLSFLVPGVGQFYNGDVGGGFLYMGCNILCNSVWMSQIETGGFGDNTVLTVGIIGGIVVNICSIVHASQGAKKSKYCTRLPS